jgi:hypothetical protein
MEWGLGEMWFDSAVVESRLRSITAKPKLTNRGMRRMRETHFDFAQ